MRRRRPKEHQVVRLERDRTMPIDGEATAALERGAEGELPEVRVADTAPLSRGCRRGGAGSIEMASVTLPIPFAFLHRLRACGKLGVWAAFPRPGLWRY
jgi:hypothetical protein